MNIALEQNELLIILSQRKWSKNDVLTNFILCCTVSFHQQVWLNRSGQIFKIHSKIMRQLAMQVFLYFRNQLLEKKIGEMAMGVSKYILQDDMLITLPLHK